MVSRSIRQLSPLSIVAVASLVKVISNVSVDTNVTPFAASITTTLTRPLIGILSFPTFVPCVTAAPVDAISISNIDHLRFFTTCERGSVAQAGDLECAPCMAGLFKYVGEYKNNERHGNGTETLANGAKYVGEWKNGNMHGQGTYTLANGTIIHRGEWVPPVIGPVDGTRLVTVAPSTYSNIMFSEEYSSPLFVTATFIEPVTKTTGDAQSIHSVVLKIVPKGLIKAINRYIVV